MLCFIQTIVRKLYFVITEITTTNHQNCTKKSAIILNSSDEKYLTKCSRTISVKHKMASASGSVGGLCPHPLPHSWTPYFLPLYRCHPCNLQTKTGSIIRPRDNKNNCEKRQTKVLCSNKKKIIWQQSISSYTVHKHQHSLHSRTKTTIWGKVPPLCLKQHICYATSHTKGMRLEEFKVPDASLVFKHLVCLSTKHHALTKHLNSNNSYNVHDVQNYAKKLQDASASKGVWKWESAQDLSPNLETWVHL